MSTRSDLSRPTAAVVSKETDGVTTVTDVVGGAGGASAQSTASAGVVDSPPTVRAKEDDPATQVKIGDDGRVNINIAHSHRRLSSLLGPAIHQQLDAPNQRKPSAPDGKDGIPSALTGHNEHLPPPPMNVVIHIVGSRGDVQPFVALGQTLKKDYGHRVRLATHPTFKTFVEENGLEFFSIGGDPAELMAFMVKNPGLMPGFETLRSGDVGKRRKGIYEILNGCWRSCIEPGDGMDEAPRHDRSEPSASIDGSLPTSVDDGARPFIADVIIANPPSFAHIHIAEKLGIPIHIMFTMPWSPTQAFPHPLANIVSSSADTSMTNFVSYTLVEMLTWQGLGDVINRFREQTLRLEPVSIMWAPGMLSRLRVPYTYCWSPALIPKPRDWGSHIDVSGFYFLPLASSYKPDPSLVAFLEAGPPPVYIGFGSIVVDDPNALTGLIFEAVRKAGVRALVSKGWGGLGTDELGKPEGIYMLGNVPHDWLFKHVSAVVHHGGAGTTAAGVALGKPTVVVPFFGDQPFWGSMIARAGAGPQPIPYKQLTADNLAAALTVALQPSTQMKAAAMGEIIRKEVGADSGAEHFHKQLDLTHLRCSLAPSRVAVWRLKRTQVRLSALAAAVLVREGLLNLQDLKLYRSMEYESDDGPWDPITGGASAVLGSLGSLAFGVADFPVEVLKALMAKPTEPESGRLSRATTSKTLSRATTGPATPALSKSNLDSTSAPSTPNGTLTTPILSMPPVTQMDGSKKDAIANAELNGDASQVSRPDEPFDVQGSEHISTVPADPDHSSHHRPCHHISLSHHSDQHAKHNHPIEPMNQAAQLLSNNPSCPACRAARHAAIEAGQGVGRIVEAGLKSPMDFTLAIAKGFHNAPKLYGDKTVRHSERVTGFQSGLRAAGKGFGYGLYDGITGLVTQPYEGAKAHGPLGFIKGVGRGFGGLILKPQAAFWSLPGYTFMGIFKEIQRHFGTSAESFIMAARTVQGFEDLERSNSEEQADILQRWNSMQEEIRKAKQTFAEGTQEKVTEFKIKRQQTINEYKQRRKGKKEDKDERTTESHRPYHHFFPALRHSRTYPGAPVKDAAPVDYEEAIQTSVAATSQGDPEQDALIERAIRASVEELVHSQQAQMDYEEALQRAVLASITEAHKTGGKVETSDEATSTVEAATTTYNDTGALEEALHQSLHDYHFPQVEHTHSEPTHLSGEESSNLHQGLQGLNLAAGDEPDAQPETVVVPKQERGGGKG